MSGDEVNSGIDKQTCSPNVDTEDSEAQLSLAEYYEGSVILDRMVKFDGQAVIAIVDGGRGKDYDQSKGG